jgi:hypothetical protein
MHLQAEKSLLGDAFLLVNGLLNKSKRLIDHFPHLFLRNFGF